MKKEHSSFGKRKRSLSKKQLKLMKPLNVKKGVNQDALEDFKT